MSKQVRRYQKAIHKNPRDAHAWFGLGRELILLNDPNAPTVLREAVVLSDDGKLCVSAGRLLAAHGHTILASAAFQKALSMSGDVSVAIDLAKTLLVLGSVSGAIEIFRAHLPSPTQTDACHLFAIALVQEGSDVEAIQHLERGLATDPNHVPSLRLLGQLSARNRNTQRAVDCFRQILGATEEATADDLVALGTAMSDLGKDEEAIRILKEARLRAPNEYEILANLGTAHIGTGEISLAIEALSEAVRVRPSGAHAHCMLGIALHQAGRSIEAVHQLREACRLRPDWAASHFNLGRLLHALGDVEGARVALEEAQRLAPEDADVRAELHSLHVEKEHGSGSITGDLEAFRLPDLLEFLRVQRSTGTLLVGARHGAGLIRLCEGELTGASAPATPRLGEILLRDRCIEPSVLGAIIEEQRVSERSRDEPELLGTILLQKQLVGSERLHAAVMEQLLAALSEMMSWSSGQFAFHASEGANPSMSFDVQRLMLEVARRADEAQR